jgi:hypothetical protein
MTLQGLMGTFVEWVALAVSVWGVWRLARWILRPKNRPELEGPPRSTS